MFGRRGWPVSAVAAVATVLVLAVATPAHATQVWYHADLTALTGATAAAEGTAFGYTTNLAGQGPVARVVYCSRTGQLQELSAASGGSWLSAQLTTAPTVAALTPFGYSTNLPGQGTVARLLYVTTDGHIHELSTAGGPWQGADLTAITGAPLAFSAPVAVSTTLTGETANVWVVYTSVTFGLQLMSLRSNGTWYTSALGEHDATGTPHIYATNLAGQGPMVRIVYTNTVRHIIEIGTVGGGGWTFDYLSDITGAPDSSGDAYGYATELAGQGSMARVVYRTTAGFIEQLSVSGGQSWRASTLAKAADALSAPSAYTTTLAGQGPTARVVYTDTARHVKELSVVGGGSWQTTDLTTAATGGLASGPAFGYATILTGQGPRARVIYTAAGGSVHEISSAG